MLSCLLLGCESIKKKTTKPYEEAIEEIINTKEDDSGKNADTDIL